MIGYLLRNTRLFRYFYMLLLVFFLTGAVDSQARIKRLKIPENTPKDVKRAIYGLYSPTPAQRATAARRLAELGKRSEPAIPFLIGVLEETTRTEHSLGFRSDIRHPQDSSPGLEARNALASIGEASVPYLVDALKSDIYWVRLRAVRALDAIGARYAEKALIASLADESALIRSETARVLGKAGIKRSATAIIPLLRDSNFEVRNGAVWALGELRENSVAENIAGLLDDKYKLVGDQAVTTLRKFGPSVTIPILSKRAEERRGYGGRAAVKSLVLMGKDSLKPLMEMLRNNVAEIRENAAMGLGLLKDRSAVRMLVRTAAKDNDYLVRAEAVLALACIADSTGLSGIYAALEDPYWYVREHAVRALANFKSQADLDRLIAMLGDPEPSVRARTAEVCGQLKLAKATPHLLDLLDGEGVYVRIKVVRALAELRAEKALKPLQNLMSDDDPYLACEASNAVARILDKSAKASARFAGRKCEDFDYVIASNDSSFLIKRLEFCDPDFCLKIAEKLRRMGAKAERPLLGALNNRNSNIRGWAVYALGRVNPSLLAENLSGLIKDKSPWVREMTIEVLRRTGDSSFAPILMQMLSDSTVSVRKKALIALGELHHKPAVEKIIENLSAEKIELRSAAAEALGFINTPAVEEPLIKSLSDSVWEVRASAAHALGKTRSVAAMESLSRLLGDDIYFVRRAAAEAFAEIGEPSLSVLFRALESKNMEKREAAALSLGMLGDVRALEYLVKALKTKHEELRVIAAWSLGEIGDRKAIEHLIHALNDRYILVKQSARKALIKITNKDYGLNSKEWKLYLQK